MLPSARFVFITLVTALICHRDGLGFASFGVFQASSAGLSSSSLHLFDWLKKSSIANDEKDSKDLKSSERLKERRVVLEKVSRTQNRDYNAEALARQPASVEVKDMQPKSFNFNKPNEFPNLYKGWIRKEGDQIAKQIMSATKTALSRGEKLIEVLFDPVPNVDEVAFGTEWNKKLRQDVIEDLKVPDIAAKRGGSSTLEWSNLYWANRLAAGISTSKQTIIAISISGEGVKSKFTPALVPNLKLVTLAEAKTGSFFQRYSTDKSLSAIIVLSPCSELHYRDAAALGDKLNGVPVIALNSPYSFRYDIGTVCILLWATIPIKILSFIRI